MSEFTPFLLAEIDAGMLKMIIMSAIVLVVVACGAVSVAIDAAHRRRLGRARLAAFERFQSSGCRTYLRVPPPDDGHLYLFSQRADLIETRKYRVSNHFGGGRRFRGIGTLAAGQSRSRSYDEWRKVDTGILYLTDRELIFIGQRYSRIFAIKDILAVAGSPLYAHITSKRRERACVFACNGLILDLILSRIEKGVA